jgi:hypothetical protein
VVAVFPLVLRRARYQGIPVRQLELIGNTASAVRCPIFGEVDDGQKEAILEAFCQYLIDEVRWEVLKLEGLPEEDFEVAMLERVLEGKDLRHRGYSYMACRYLDGIQGTGDAYMASRDRHVRRNAKALERKFGKDGRFRSEMVTEGDDATLDRYMDAYDRVFEKSWKPWEAQPAFDRALARMARDKGRLRLGLFFVDDEAVAGQLWMVCDGTAFAVATAYDGAYRKYSPGVGTLAAMMRYVIDHDHVQEVDYLLGDDEYKKDWMPRRRERRAILAFNTKGWRGRLLSGVITKVTPVMRSNRVLGLVRRGILRLLRVK